MRTKKDSDVILFNGDGFEYAATLLNENLKNCSVSVNKKVRTQCESPVRIILLQGISRSDRMDACIQKSTELGVNIIVPILCERTTTKLKDNRAEKKIAHWQQVIISACEQSGRCVIPELQSIATYTQALQAANSSCKLVLVPDSKTGLGNIQTPEDDIYILVGPEGGLTRDEIKFACDMNFKGIQLGPRILRTETTGPACIAAIQTLWGDLGGI
jgi:16S rRNA (uracil1498-N3)-methyltransferase